MYSLFIVIKANYFNVLKSEYVRVLFEAVTH